MMEAVAHGSCDVRFAPVADRFAEMLTHDDGYSAQLSIRLHGEPVVDLAGGTYLAARSLTGVYSVSKGVSALVIAHLIDQTAIEPDRVVSHYWPEFGAAGKANVTVRQLLGHQAGLPVAARRLSLDEVLDSRAAADVLAAQRPVWRPGTAFGYHALTIGVLMEELVRRVTGTTLQTVYEAAIRGPIGADFFLGLPEIEDSRYVPVDDPKPTAAEVAELAARPPVDALQEAVFSNVDAPEDRSDRGMSTNNPLVRRAGAAAIGGVGSASGLSQLYAAALGTGRVRIAAPEVFADMAQQQSWGTDRVLGVPNCFGMVFMLPQPRMPYGGLGSFGHDGAGGALAFADPTSGLSFGYIPAPMQYPGGADGRSIELARLAAHVVNHA
ncbi:serine hydrolase [Microbacterium sp. STN6]|uniref:serine hydrolase domain-containing protein n=1 Tax=Microbacterium sp. STN6 TaxID=2995588 RepID=UPI002260F9F0|nr:serine hydrolase domain-containing protein [Microbacterium sp. STN6]MCX7522855.1 serine hydrolase [Microbacterium sp. STN6]